MIANWLRRLFCGSSKNGQRSALPSSPQALLGSLSQEQNKAWRADERSERAILRLEKETGVLAREHLRRLTVRGLDFRITSGLRTFAEQKELYDQGRTTPGKIVTNARPGSSWHNFGVAYDITEFQNGRPVWESSNYTIAGHIGEGLGLEWGGRWKSIVDRPHFQRKMGMSLAAAREKWPNGVIA